MRMQRRKVAPRFSEGARLLWAILQRNSWTQQQLAEVLGVGRGVVNHWLYGTRRPGLLARMSIQDKFRIKWQAWEEVPAESFATPAAAATGTEG